MDQQTNLERAVARKLKNARENRPTFASQFWRWKSGSGLLVVGLASTGILAILAQGEGSALSRDWPIAIATFFLGGLCRDIGIARRATRTWAAQETFIDWSKVDEVLAE